MAQPKPTFQPEDIPDAKIAVGVIDDGIAFAHERFRKADGRSTRFGAIWLQEIAPGKTNRWSTSQPKTGLAFGTHLTAADIERLIADTDGDEREIYRRTGQLDFTSHENVTLGYRTTHGTHVCDLAAGCDGGDETNTPLIFAVQIPSAMTAESSGVSMATYVLQAFRQLLVWADAKSPQLPLVINFSFGNFAGRRMAMR